MKKIEFISATRSIAILYVIAAHSLDINSVDKYTYAVFNYGRSGVFLFFLASAFSLCYSIEKRQEGNFLFFYIRRFFRIAPLYYFAILFFFLWRHFKFFYEFALSNDFNFQNLNYFQFYNFNEFGFYNLKSILSNVFFIHSFYPPANNNIVPGGWSIGAEMFFYLCFPLAFSLFYKKNIFKIIILSIASIIFYNILTKYFSHYDYLIFISKSAFLPLIPFCFGIVLYKNFEKFTISNTSNLLMFLFLTFIAIILSNYHHLPGIYYFVTSISWCFLINFLSKINFKKNILTNMFINLGNYSYSAYIFHFFVLDLIKHLFVIKMELYLNNYFLLIATYFMAIIFTFFIAKISANSIEKYGILFGKKIINKIKN